MTLKSIQAIDLEKLTSWHIPQSDRMLSEKHSGGKMENYKKENIPSLTHTHTNPIIDETVLGSFPSFFILSLQMLPAVEARYCFQLTTANANFTQHPYGCHEMEGESGLYLANTKLGLKISRQSFQERCRAVALLSYIFIQ